MSDFDCDPLFSRIYLEVLGQMTAAPPGRRGGDGAGGGGGGAGESGGVRGKGGSRDSG